MGLKIHIINHTHWDREWLLTSAYTRQWIPDLIDRLAKLVDNNPQYKFLFDGQSLVIEDLLEVAPNYKDKVEKLITNGNLIIGPYYCQPDWRMIDGESLIRNILYGLQDTRRWGGNQRVGWLVDNFGHISQTPQLHQMFDIDSVYVWRGVPELEPFFHWQGSDGKELFTISLIAGYRNLYGVTHVPEVAIKRLAAEANKLRSLYPTEDIPLFDGYDLDQNPEDAIFFYEHQSSSILEGFALQQSSDFDFAEEMNNKLSNIPVVVGELNSGKYAATFPGTLSSRTYLKIMNRDCEHLLYQLCEPLAVMARLKGKKYNSRQFETWGRALLQNAAHDCICGVSIDQVHEKMEHSYANLFHDLNQDVKASLQYMLKDNAPGRYAISTNPFHYEGWQIIGKQVYRIKTYGIGIWEVGYHESLNQPEEPVDIFQWQNNHYSAILSADGIVHLGDAALGYLVVSEESGDTYSDEVGNYQSICEVKGPLIIEQRSKHLCTVRFDCGVQWGKMNVSARVRITFDQTPLIRWEIELDSRGTNFRVEIVFETAEIGDIYAGMPFDIVKRSMTDTDLLPRHLSSDLSTILLGQREVNQVKTFPFKDFVGFSDGASSAIIFAKGTYTYNAGGNGTISLPLRRSVEWLTISNLRHRVGDAGPTMYVPDARCERIVKHELGVMVASFDINDIVVQKINTGFQNPPLIVDSTSTGKQGNWRILQEDLPMSSLCVSNQKILARFYNPTNKEYELKKAYQRTDVWSNSKSKCRKILAKEIITTEIVDQLPPIKFLSDECNVIPVNVPAWRVGKNQGCPSQNTIDELKNRIARLELRLVKVEEELTHTEGKTLYSLRRTFYMLKRELYELRLSVILNEKKISMEQISNDEYLYAPDPDIAQLGMELNELRIKKRVYDYIATL
ncbi:MAG TPA: hypothetical protein DDX29_01120 [Clostridiales bacterium]|nr:hypothetical protein [Clostridiales bacterium]